MRGRRTKAAIPATKRTVLYIRCSTDEQAREGTSLAAQEACLRRYAAGMEGIGRTIDEVVVDDGRSAKNLKRPGIERVCKDVKSGLVGTVIVTKLDRLTRSVGDLAKLLDMFAKSNAALVSVGESLDTQSAAGRMVVNMLGVVAQWEREVIAERTADGHAQLRSEGRVYSGRTPFGYREQVRKVEGKPVRFLVPDPKKQPALPIIRSMHENGQGASLRMIADALTKRGVKPPRGARWYASSVKAIIDSRMYQERMGANAST